MCFWNFKHLKVAIARTSFIRSNHAERTQNNFILTIYNYFIHGPTVQERNHRKTSSLPFKTSSFMGHYVSTGVPNPCCQLCYLTLFLGYNKIKTINKMYTSLSYCLLAKGEIISHLNMAQAKLSLSILSDNVTVIQKW